MGMDPEDAIIEVEKLAKSYALALDRERDALLEVAALRESNEAFRLTYVDPNSPHSQTIAALVARAETAEASNLRMRAETLEEAAQACECATGNKATGGFFAKTVRALAASPPKPVEEKT